MLGSALIVFREVLEAALVIGIACAATRGISGRNGWVTVGIGAGVIGACVVAGFAEAISGYAEGMGQELLNALILLAAVLMLGWHNVWMARHGREMAQQMSALGKSVQSGARPLYVLGIVIGLAVLREGSEVVLFLYGLAAGGSTAAGMLAGGGIGLVTGAALGVLLYLGLLRVPTKHFFTVTSWMILLLAAGMASQAAGFLIQADYLPAWGSMWDSSHIVSGDSIVGKILQTLVGYDAHPAGMQLLFYVVTLTTIGVAMKLLGRPVAAPRAALAALAVVTLAAALAAPRAEAGPADKVYKPMVEYGETEVELRAGYVKDARDEMNTAQAYVLDFGHGVTTWWFTEAVVEMEKEPDASFEAEEVEWENIFQLTEQGQYFVDLGLFAEAKMPLEPEYPFGLEVGPMFQKETGRIVHNLNVLAEWTFGNGFRTGSEIGYRLQSRWHGGTPVEAGLQGFGEENAHLLGPAIFGAGRLNEHGKYKWDAAVLAGLTPEAEDWRLRWQLELEF
jgi:high-affinity iron transporter